jgi:4,5-dihydroxyphthalate decarboxylase
VVARANARSLARIVFSPDTPGVYATLAFVARVLRTLLGDYPVTHALRTGAVRSPSVTLDFANEPRPAAAFKRVVRSLEFDVAELAIVTFLMAKAYGKPLVLLPAVVVSRFQHPYLVYNAARGKLAPADLAGKRIAIRSWTVTTVTWLRGILAEQGVDLGGIEWVTFEEPHVAEFVDPPNLQRAPAGKTLNAMLLDGEVDAAIVGEPIDDPRVKTVFPDPAAEARAWQQRHGALQINHMVVVHADLSRNEPALVREVWRLLVESRDLASAGATASAPFGLEANRRNLEVAVDYVHRQGLIPRRFTVDELFDDTSGLSLERRPA